MSWRWGNPAARDQNRARSRREYRRCRAILPEVLPDLRNRAGIEETFGFGDLRSIDGTPERFRWLASRWFARHTA